MKVINKSKISIFCILLLLVGVAGLGDQTISLTAAQMNDTAKFDNMLAYENPNLGFSLEYPADWSKEENLTIKSPRPSPNQPTSSP